MRLMNVFEQSSGSARNVAIVLEMADSKVHEPMARYRTQGERS